MYKFSTIESEKYELAEDGMHVKHVGMIKAGEAFDKLYEHLEAHGLLPDEYFSFNDYNLGREAELPLFKTAICHTDWGGSEGIYIDIYFAYSEDRQPKMMHFATGKTLDSDGDAFLKMSRIAAECSMMLNGRGSMVRISEQNYDKLPEKEQNPSLDEKISSAKAQAAEGKAVNSPEKDIGR